MGEAISASRLWRIRWLLSLAMLLVGLTVGTSCSSIQDVVDDLVVKSLRHSVGPRSGWLGMFTRSAWERSVKSGPVPIIRMLLHSKDTAIRSRTLGFYLESPRSRDMSELRDLLRSLPRPLAYEGGEPQADVLELFWQIDVRSGLRGAGCPHAAQDLEKLAKATVSVVSATSWVNAEAIIRHHARQAIDRDIGLLDKTLGGCTCELCQRRAH